MDNDVKKEEIVKAKDNKEIASDLMLEEIIAKSIQIPGVKVDRNKFLAEELSSKPDLMEKILKDGPIEAGVSRDEISNIANKLIIKRTSQSSLVSFAAGIPGGLAMAATIPADILQFFGMSLKLAQELSYLYGASDIWEDGKVDDEKIKNQLILYCGVMFGVSGAMNGVRVLSVQLAKTAAHKIPQKALTKTFYYPMIKKICKVFTISVTKKAFGQGVSKIIPVVGGVISGTINFASMMPMAKKLKTTLDKAAFDYSEEEYNNDIEILTNENGEVTEEEKKSFKEKLSSGLNKTKDNVSSGVSNIIGKMSKKENNKENQEEDKKEEQTDPFEEIKKYKELLDLNIITQEEFDKKKKELLNL